jgi:flagellar export protein FliJ
MKKFRFSLRPVSIVRAHRETRAREVFAASVQSFIRSEEDLAQVRTRIAQFGATIFASRRERFEASEHAICLAGYRRECAAEIPAEKAVFLARSEMERRRAEYIEAHRHMEAVNKLEEKSRAAHRLDLNREEQAEFDDRGRLRVGNRALSI